MHNSNNNPNGSASCLKVRFSQAGIHLFDRWTGINVLLDEFIPPSHMWSTAPRQVSIALTNDCNLECQHCYAPKYQKELDFNKLTDWFVELDANGCMGVGFGGGEPTLYPRLAELCSFIVRRTGLAVTITTNAHHISNKLLKALEGNLHFIRVSMDGVNETYESIRGSSFEKLLINISALSHIAPLGINYLVNSQTFDCLDTAVALATDLGAKEFLLLPEEPVGESGGIDKKTTTSFQEWVAKYRGSLPLVVSEGKAEGLPTCNPFTIESGLTSFAHIDASGKLKRTSYDADGVPILNDGIIHTLKKLNAMNLEVCQ